MLYNTAPHYFGSPDFMRASKHNRYITSPMPKRIIFLCKWGHQCYWTSCSNAECLQLYRLLKLLFRCSLPPSHPSGPKHWLVKSLVGTLLLVNFHLDLTRRVCSKIYTKFPAMGSSLLKIILLYDITATTFANVFPTLPGLLVAY